MEILRAKNTTKTIHQHHAASKLTYTDF